MHDVSFGPVLVVTGHGLVMVVIPSVGVVGLVAVHRRHRRFRSVHVVNYY